MPENRHDDEDARTPRHRSDAIPDKTKPPEPDARDESALEAFDQEGAGIAAKE